MRRLTLWVLLGYISIVAFADELVSAPALNAAQIVEKNIAARGGSEAWQKIQTMIWIGHVESANTPAPSLPFVLEQKRPNKTRFEIKAQNQMAVRVYDGTHGWKVRTASNGKPELEPYSTAELSFARDWQSIDGPLMDYQAKGIAVTLDGLDEVEGHKAYRLNVKLPSGASHHVWIDAQSFLEIKYDRESRNAFGMSGMVSVLYRNYQSIEGLQIPLLIESGADTAKVTDKMVIDKILLNPPLEDRMFTKPSMPGRRNVVSIDATRPEARRAATALTSGIARPMPQLVPRPMSGSRDTQ